MGDELKQDLLHSLFYLKKVSIAISRSALNPGDSALSVAELSALNCIGNCGKRDCRKAEIAADSAPDTAHHAMHETLAVSKAAVSQMLANLEKRGFIRREPNRDNRRQIIITLTAGGKAAVDEGEKYMDELTSRIIRSFGEEDMRTFMRLLTRFAEVVDEEVR
jgi:DNA-binding MarR family transcriptional regulator